VDFIDSSGLGAIVSALKTIGRNGDLVLCGIKETVMSLFRLTRMDRVFRIFTDQGEATAALSS
jgi:anti-sigma B factor antagonist